MQNIHKTTIGVYWPIHRGWCRGSRTKGDLGTSAGGTHRGAGRGTEAIIHITTRGLGSKYIDVLNYKCKTCIRQHTIDN